MPIKSLTLKGLRGFSNSQSLQLAIPTGEPGSGLTILLGPNNGGKSTIIEAFRAITAQGKLSFTEGKRNKKADDRVSIEVKYADGERYSLRTVEEGGSETLREPDHNLPSAVYVLPARRYFKPYFGRDRHERDAYARSVGLPQTRGAALDQFAGRLFRVLEQRSAFDEVLGRVLAPTPDWTIDQSDTGQYYLKFNAKGQHHTSDGLGEGLVSLLFIIDALYDSTMGAVIVIDEPELSLHPTLQRRLAGLLADYSRDRQIVYATHSPYFIDFSWPTNGAEVARVHRPSEGCAISHLQRETITELKGLMENRNNPHILGLDAREAFFMEDGLVLVEGQEDVVFYTRYMKETHPEIAERFYGWGAGGASNVRLIAALLRDLGFSRVAAILDGNKCDLVASLKKDFPSYHFVAIPASDVRTKAPQPARGAVDGLFGPDGSLRAEFAHEANQVFKQINDYIMASHRSGDGIPDRSREKT